MADAAPHPTWQYRPGELVLAVELPADEREHAEVHGRVRSAVEQRLAGSAGGVFQDRQTRPAPVVFRAPDSPPLGFLFYDLAQPDDHGHTRSVVGQVAADPAAALEPLAGGGVRPIGVMPHWLGAAQQGMHDGSPATIPRPARPPGDGRWRYRYTPRNPALDTRARLDGADGPRVDVLVLDTAPRWGHARQQAERFAATNPQLREVFDLLAASPLDPWHAEAARAMREGDLRLAPSPDGRVHEYDMSDHGLFVAGLIHDLAPRSTVRLRPVLNPRGVGDLHLLLRVLADEVARKTPDTPLVINMSLAFAPKLEHLPWLWWGLDPPHDPEFVGDAPTAAAARAAGGPAHPGDRPWLDAHREMVEATTYLLHSGIDRLARYLLANNCLGVAASGNDSGRRVAEDRPRLGPRVPARYQSVLGVAATGTTGDPTRGARYSNAGDDHEYGDHVATFGGDVGAGNAPDPGVVGVYTAATFPVPPGTAAAGTQPNDTGWAVWSGTSFATGIVSGLAAGLWAERLGQTPGLRAAEVLQGFNLLADGYAADLRTPSVAVDGAWERA